MAKQKIIFPLKPPFIRDFPWLCNKLPEGKVDMQFGQVFFVMFPSFKAALHCARE
jgi:hypothetical protein